MQTVLGQVIGFACTRYFLAKSFLNQTIFKDLFCRAILRSYYNW